MNQTRDRNESRSGLDEKGIGRTGSPVKRGAVLRRRNRALCRKEDSVMKNAGCAWSRNDALLRRYHDTEWGVPVRDDRLLFEHLTLEVMQCGLNWLLMLKKREIFRQALAGFDPSRLAAFTENDVNAALAVPGMIRSRRKVEAVAANAARLSRRAEGIRLLSRLAVELYRRAHAGVRKSRRVRPASNELSDRISAALKKRGFRYVGSITVYSLLQACGVVNDHEPDCPRFPKSCAASRRRIRNAGPLFRGIMKLLSLIVSLAVTLGAHAACAAQSSVSTYTEEAPSVSIRATWQRFGLTRPDNASDDTVRSAVAAFRSMAAEEREQMLSLHADDPDAPEHPYEMDLEGVISGNDKVAGILWKDYQYLGGAHGSLTLSSRNYTRSDGRRCGFRISSAGLTRR